MSPDFVVQRVALIENLAERVSGLHVEMFKVDVLPKGRIDLRLRIRFRHGELFEANEIVVDSKDAETYLL